MKNILTLSIDEAYEMTGKFSIYHLRLLTGCLLGYFTTSIYLYGMSLFQIFPEVGGCPEGLCRNATEACQHDYYYIDKKFNFLSEFDLICHDYRGAIIPSLFNIDFLGSCVLIGTIIDNWGRFTAMMMGNSGNILAFLTLISFSSFTTTLASSFVLGLFHSMLQSSIFSMMYDTFHSRYWIFAAAFVNSIWGLGAIFSGAIMSLQIRWRTMISINIGIAILFYIALFFIVEPPRYLYSRGRGNEAVKSLQYIACANSRDLPCNLILDDPIKDTKSATFKESLRIIFTVKFLKRLCLLLMLYITDAFVYFGIVFSLQRFAGNIYLNTVILGMQTQSKRLTVKFFSLKCFDQK